eukprot:TRINITY_DN45325_c0_g1_i1.p1 TRINITY_DN45325_c0_g1~~TRINITY_DN45325_c0_g1_i1.p1  ORF type:complete len:163 (+),score=24.96 TRINITY_DN45325_c0_g1_i1:114-602(+)
MSNLQATKARTFTGKYTPLAVMENNSSRIIDMTNRQESRYIRGWTDRIDGESRTQQSMQQHMSLKEMRLHETKERHRAKNAAWADRAVEARRWRDYTAAQKLERCQNNVENKDHKLTRYNSWYDRILVQTPKQLLQKRSDNMARTMSSSNLEVEKYQRAVLG